MKRTQHMPIATLRQARMRRSRDERGARDVNPPVDALPKLGEGRELLLVEHAASPKLRRRELEILGFDVECACDGLSALRAARATQHDAVICDVELPLLSGHALCAAIRSDAFIAGTPVILVSGARRGEADRILGLAAGASSYLVREGTSTDQLEALLVALLTAFAASRA